MSDTRSSDTLSNAAEFTVSELSGALRRTIEDTFGHVRVRGEISGFRGQHGSGHCYFSLKDEGAKIDAIVWKGTYGRLRTKPQEGLEVIATGRITTYPGKSSYQIVIDSLEPAGVGALMALLEERKRKLAAEGLFADSRKRALPYLPTVIGVVTSPTGAVIRDILHRLEDRFPRHVLVWPVRVQGETCGAEVAAAVRGFNEFGRDPRLPRPDVLIVARGGGSIEDLWGFNDEAVVRAVAESAIPVVSAVGHETDWTLIDFAADRRAPTPTGAAEMVVPVRLDLLAQVRDLSRRHGEGMLRFLERRRADWRSAARALPSPDMLLAPRRQRLDLAAARLAPALARSARTHEGRLRQAANRLARLSPLARLTGLRARLDAVGERPAFALSRRIGRDAERLALIHERLAPAFASQLARKAQTLASLDKLRESLSHKSVLARGFALVRDEKRVPVRSAGAVAEGACLVIEFADGEVPVTAGTAGEAAAPPNPTAPKPRGKAAPVREPGPGTSQGSLF